MSVNPIIVALDTTDVKYACRLSSQLSEHVGAVKLGLEFFTAHGSAGVREIAKTGMPIFLDLKFHDIPNTVAKTIRALSSLKVFMFTIHTSGGKAMMEAAAKAISETFLYDNPPSVVGVTMLTSLDEGDLKTIGMSDGISGQVERLAKLAQKSGLNGVVCSAHEIETLRKVCGPSFKLVVPGIRPEGSLNSDQKRVMTPREALRKGANYLVIGRPITEANDPVWAVKEIITSIAA